jgi:hypothetical protein
MILDLERGDEIETKARLCGEKQRSVIFMS